MTAKDRDNLQYAMSKIWGLLEKRCEEAYEVQELRKLNRSLAKQVEKLKAENECLKRGLK